MCVWYFTQVILTKGIMYSKNEKTKNVYLNWFFSGKIHENNNK